MDTRLGGRMRAMFSAGAHGSNIWQLYTAKDVCGYETFESALTCSHAAKDGPIRPVLGATFVGQRTFRADGAIAPLLSDHGSGATPGLISASTQSLLSPSPSRGNLAVTMASSRSCHQLGTLESADIARLRSSTSSSALLSRKMPSAAGPRRGGGAMR